MATPGRSKHFSSLAVPRPPQLFVTTFAPRATAVSSANSRSAGVGEVAATSRMWQLGQMAETMSMSRDSSTSQPPVGSGFGSAVALPFSFTSVTQPSPVAVSQAGRPHCTR